MVAGRSFDKATVLVMFVGTWHRYDISAIFVVLVLAKPRFFINYAEFIVFMSARDSFDVSAILVVLMGAGLRFDITAVLVMDVAAFELTREREVYTGQGQERQYHQ